MFFTASSTRAGCFLIETPPKVWRPKVKNQYIPCTHTTDIDDGFFDYQCYGKTFFRPKTVTTTPSTRNDIIVFDGAADDTELESNLKVGTNVDPTFRQRVKDVIIKYWDCFCKRGARRTILGYEFALDTGGAPPVCARAIQYGPHESKIIMTQIEDLLKNDWIEECEGPWGSIIVLAPKPHQEHVEHIEDFVWRMCVSYRGLNKVTLPFAYPIPRCDDAIAVLNVGGVRIYLITVDAKQGYHQVAVKRSDQSKLAFFAPNNKKYTFKVMPFGPTNAPAFYTCMMQEFREEWDALFLQMLRDEVHFPDKTVRVTETHEVFVNETSIPNGSKGIIDDILIWSSDLDCILTYFEAVCRIFQQYRVSFRLDKCEFLKDRVEYVGHDLMADGNCPAASKFDMISNWPLPRTSQALHSFIGLVNFYHNYSPYFELRLKPLRQFYRRFLREEIPISAWTPALLELFHEIKDCITSSPTLVRYDPTQPTFLKTDWSSEGMGWILMQPDHDVESQKATKQLLATGECLFDVSRTGARLRPVQFGSRACTSVESRFHSFVGEVACGRWAIAQNRRYLWGTHFYWMCDCSAVKEILEYSGNISMIQRWAQELLGYHFSVIHRPARMMVDVDALSRRYGKPIATHIAVACIFRARDKHQRPSAYQDSRFHDRSNKPTKVTEDTTSADFPPWPILSHRGIVSMTASDDTTHKHIEPTNASIFLTTTPIKMIEPQHQQSLLTPKDKLAKSSTVAIHEQLRCLVIDDILGSFLLWATESAPPPLAWDVTPLFSHTDSSILFSSMFPHREFRILETKRIQSQLSFEFEQGYNIIDATFIPYMNGSIFEWLQAILHLISQDAACTNELLLVTAWINTAYLPHSFKDTLHKLMSTELHNHWVFSIHEYELTQFSVPLAGKRACITMSNTHSECTFSTTRVQEFCTSDSTRYGSHLSSLFNTEQGDCSVLIPDPSTLTSDHPTHEEDPTVPRIIGRIHRQDQHTSATTTSSHILHPDHPAYEPNISASNQLFGHRFGVPFQNKNGTWFTRGLSTLELLRLYGVNDTHLNNPTTLFRLDHAADNLLPCCVPSNFRNTFMNANDSPWTELSSTLALGPDLHTSSSQCFVISSTTAAPCTLDWTAAYHRDKDTNAIISNFRKEKPQVWSPAILATIHSSYHSFLKAGHIQTMHGKLVLFKPIQTNSKYIGLIIVPEPLRHRLFSHYHAGPSGGHMGEYKTLYRMRSRFFWPKMRNDIKTWVKGCPHCVSYNVWRDRRSELYFSWPVTTPFWIMHIDLWSPGEFINEDGKKGYLMNAVCDLTQFVVSVPTFDTTASTLSQLFMEHVLLSYGICAVVVVDDGSTFKGIFKEMIELLKITLWTLSRGNHKGNSAERYHRFLNKTQAITGNDRGTHGNFIQNAKTSQYAWNSAPIDGTDVPRSVAAIGRQFRFPLDTEFLQPPQLEDGEQSRLHQYLRDVSNESKFAEGVLQILVEERRAAHNERNNQRYSKGYESPFKVGDIVKAHVQVNSNAKTGTVKKLSYRARGPFKITKALGHNSFEVQKYGDPSSATRQYKGTELYLLPPALFPSEPLDTIDQRYLNYDYAPVQSPLKKSMQIELYNTTYFQPRPPKTKSPHVNKPSTYVDSVAFESHDIPSLSDLHRSTNTTPPEPESESTTLATTEPNNIHDMILQSKDKLFFIRFTPAQTMRARWYLVQVNIEDTQELNADYIKNGIYYCCFLAKHPSDTGKSDEFSRWWPDWYEYHRCKQTDDIVFGDRILFAPNRKPDGDKYIQWAEEVDLISDQHRLIGPFDFEAISAANRTRYKVEGKVWRKCFDICLSLNITPPTTGSQSSNVPTRKQSKRKRGNSQSK